MLPFMLPALLQVRPREMSAAMSNVDVLDDELLIVSISDVWHELEQHNICVVHPYACILNRHGDRHFSRIPLCVEIQRCLN